MNWTNNSLLFRYYPLIILLILLAVSFYRVREKSLTGVIWSDAEGYYLYLPAVFIYGGFEGIPYITEVQFSNYPGTDKLFTKYTCGVAMLELPFFLAAHAFALADDGMPADGFSAYYRYGIMAAAIFYAFLGILLLRRVLERYYQPGVVFVTIVALFFGTNMYFYTVGEPGMSHIYSFFLFALLLYLTPWFYRRGDASAMALTGLLSGLIVLIRPTNAVLLLYLLLFDLRSWRGLRERLHWFGRRLPGLLLFAAVSLLVFTPQFVYWKYLSGEWLLYSYGEEGFSNWNSPKLMHVLFSITNGWLLFAPVSIFALAGMYPGLCRWKHNIPVIALITGISLYLFASWWMWFFGGAFGYRPMVEFYALLAIPFGLLAQGIYRRGSWTGKVLFTLTLALLVYYTQELTYYKVGPHYTWTTWREAMDQMIPYWNIAK